MPRLSVLYIRLSLVHLLLAVSLGGLLLANKGILISPAIWALLPLHIEFAFVGWMVQLALGMVFWIVPRFSRGAPRGDERWSWLACILLNVGILCVAAQVIAGGSVLAFPGRLLEMLGLGAFAIGNWRRVKPIGA